MRWRPAGGGDLSESSIIQNRFPSTAITRSRRARPSRQGLESSEVRGLGDNKKSWTPGELLQLTAGQAVTRHICRRGIERIGSWETGTPRLARIFLKPGGLRTPVPQKYCGFRCADPDGYNLTARPGPSLLHPRPEMTFKFSADEIPAPRLWPDPMEDPGADKLGFRTRNTCLDWKSPTNSKGGGYWEDQGYQFVQRKLIFRHSPDVQLHIGGCATWAQAGSILPRSRGLWIFRRASVFTRARNDGGVCLSRTSPSL